MSSIQYTNEYYKGVPQKGSQPKPIVHNGSSRTVNGCFCKTDEPCGSQKKLEKGKNWCYTEGTCGIEEQDWDYCEKPLTRKGYKCKTGEVCDKEYNGQHYCDVEPGSHEKWDYCTPSYKGNETWEGEDNCRPGHHTTYEDLNDEAECRSTLPLCNPGHRLKQYKDDMFQLSKCVPCEDGRYIDYSGGTGWGINPFHSDASIWSREKFNESEQYQTSGYLFQCLPKTTTCPTGKKLEKYNSATQNDECIDCPALQPGQTFSGNECETTCKEGFVSNGESCVCDAGTILMSPDTQTKNNVQCVSYTDVDNSYRTLGNQNHCTSKDDTTGFWCYTSETEYESCNKVDNTALTCVDCNNLPQNAQYTGDECTWDCNDGFVKKNENCEAILTGCEKGKTLNSGSNTCDACPALEDENATFTTDNSCAWDCETGFVKKNGTCDLQYNIAEEEAKTALVDVFEAVIQETKTNNNIWCECTKPCGTEELWDGKNWCYTQKPCNTTWRFCDDRYYTIKGGIFQESPCPEGHDIEDIMECMDAAEQLGFNKACNTIEDCPTGWNGNIPCIKHGPDDWGVFPYYNSQSEDDIVLCKRS